MAEEEATTRYRQHETGVLNPAGRCVARRETTDSPFVVDQLQEEPKNCTPKIDIVKCERVLQIAE
jgi:hypothetical protein